MEMSRDNDQTRKESPFMEMSRDKDQKRKESPYMEITRDKEQKKMRIEVKKCNSKIIL